MKQIPIPIQRTLLKTILVSCAIMAFGLIWGLVSRDHSFLGLTAAVGVLAGLKILGLYRMAQQQHYEVLEGLVCSDLRVPLRNRHLLALTDQAQQEHRIMISGKNTLTPGATYRLYISGADDQIALASLPEPLIPARTLLGYELLD